MVESIVIRRVALSVVGRCQGSSLVPIDRVKPEERLQCEKGKICSFLGDTFIRQMYASFQQEYSKVLVVGRSQTRTGVWQGEPCWNVEVVLCTLRSSVLNLQE